MTKTAEKKHKPKNIKLLNSANKAAACLVELANKNSHEETKFSTFEEMQAYMKEQVKEHKKTHADESSEDSDGDRESE
jgi:hypothetical protein